MRKIKYDTTTGFILAVGNMPGLTAGAGEAVADYTGAVPANLGHKKVDIAALPTISVIDKTAGEIATFDNSNTLATASDIETRFATKVAVADQITFLKELAKLQAEGNATKTAVTAL